jgi:hypothetical protein
MKKLLKKLKAWRQQVVDIVYNARYFRQQLLCARLGIPFVVHNFWPAWYSHTYDKWRERTLGGLHVEEFDIEDAKAGKTIHLATGTSYKYYYRCTGYKKITDESYLLTPYEFDFRFSHRKSRVS